MNKHCGWSAVAILVSFSVSVLWGADVRYELTVDGRMRSYLVHVPPVVFRSPQSSKKAQSNRPWPIVLAFHGGGGSGRQFARHTHLNDKADRAGFIVVYPNGTGPLRKDWLLTWNAGNCCGYAQKRGVDDVKFIRLLLRDLKKYYRVDATRIYATGMSNGAMMCYRLAIELPNVLAAIAPVAGVLGFSDARPQSDMPILHIHGTADQHVPYGGGIGKRSLVHVKFMSVAACLDLWKNVNHCTSKPVVTYLPDRVADGTRVKKERYVPDLNKNREHGKPGKPGKPGNPGNPGIPGEKKKSRGAPIVLYTIENGGHCWPGRPSADHWHKPVLTTHDMDPNDVIWHFFKQQRRHAP